MPAGEKPRFDVNMGYILCHDNPVFTVLMRYSLGDIQHRSNNEEGVKKCKKGGFSAAFSVIRVKCFDLLFLFRLLQHRHFINVERAVIQLAGDAYVMPFVTLQRILIINGDDALVFF